MERIFILIAEDDADDRYLLQAAFEENELKENDLELYYNNKKHIFTFKDKDRKAFTKQKEINRIKKWLQFPVLGFNNSFCDKVTSISVFSSFQPPSCIFQ